jgi:lipopolysaccharide export system permease protein
MKLLDRYLALTVIRFIFLVLLIVMGMELFILVVGEFPDIGHGNYGIWQAFLYCLLSLPSNLYQLFPMVSLLGCLIGLGFLGSHGELLAMRASGVHIFHIAKVVLTATLVLVVLVTLVGEGLAPGIQHYASKMKLLASSEGSAIGTAHGVWFRNKNHFIHIGTVMPDLQLINVTQYQFNARHHLQSALHAASAVEKNHHWQLKQVTESSIKKNHVSSSASATMPWHVPIDAVLLGASHENFASDINLWDLYHYIRLQHKTGMSTRAYALNFWQRVLQPFSALVMVFLAISFVFGPLRGVMMGVRIVVGATAGFSFYLLNQFFGPFSLVYQMPPLLGAALPTLLFALLGVWLLLRVR